MSKRILLGLGILLFAGLCLAQVFVLQRRPTPAAAAGWVPTSIPGCTIWLAADQSELSAYTNGQQVTTWYDKSGNGTHFTNPPVNLSGTRTNPTFLVSVKNSKPGVFFNQTVNTQYLQRASSYITNMFQTNDGYWFLVTSNAPAAQFFAWYLTGDNRFKVVKLSGNLWFYAGENDSVTFGNPTDFTLYSGWISNQLSVGAFSNNVLRGGTAHTATRSNLVGGLYLGWDGWDARGEICVLEMITYNRCLTPAEATEVRSNLNVKYALW